MASTADIIAARTDADLLARLIATADRLRIDQAQARVEAARGRIVAQTITVNGEQTSLATVLAYAAGQYQDGPRIVSGEWVRSLRPGENPAAVTDDHLTAAVTAALTPPTP